MVKKRTKKRLYGLLAIIIAINPWVAFADTFTPSADGYGTSATDQVSFATKRSESMSAVTTTTDDAEAKLSTLDAGAGTYRILIRSKYCFDTSSLPDTDTIDSAIFEVFGTGVSDLLSSSAVLDHASTTTLTNSDFDLSTLDNVEQASNRVTFAAWSTSAYNQFTLNATGISHINKSGTTCFVMRESHDFDNAAPGSYTANANNYITGYFSENASNEPQLVVTHSAASSSSSSSSAMSSSSECSGTGCNLNSSGSLVITSSACEHYILNGSGAAIGCDQWDTAIKIPALKAIQSQFAYIIYSNSISIFEWLWMIILVFIPTRWLFRIITHKRTKYYR